MNVMYSIRRNTTDCLFLLKLVYICINNMGNTVIIEKFCECLHCGVRFSVVYKGRKYCTDACSQSAYRRRRLGLLIDKK